MTMHQTDNRPFHQRMDGAAMKHLVNVLKHLSGGNIGFDVYRNPATSTKELLIPYILNGWTGEQIDAAHVAACAAYPASSGRGRRGRRVAHNVNPALLSPAPQIAEPSASVAPVAVPASAPGNDPSLVLNGLTALIASMVADRVTSQLVDINKTVERIAAEVAEATASANAGGVGVLATVVELKRADLPSVSLGLQHKQFATLLQMCAARSLSGGGLNIWVYGPAGTGKTTAAEKVAEALELPFRYNGALDTRYELLGFIDAQGRTVRTPFRDAWEHGGVYLFDEIDASNPNALLALNGALANGTCPFPDGMVPRHKDCIILAGANTTGLGATIEYVGRMKQDASLLDRFCFLHWPIDEALELALCPDKAWCEYVQRVRANVAARGIKGAMITPRATFHGAALLAAGLPRETVILATLRKSMADDVWSQIA